jgi:hypothetical protein
VGVGVTVGAGLKLHCAAVTPLMAAIPVSPCIPAYVASLDLNLLFNIRNEVDEL